MSLKKFLSLMLAAAIVSSACACNNETHAAEEVTNDMLSRQEEELVSEELSNDEEITTSYVVSESILPETTVETTFENIERSRVEEKAYVEAEGNASEYDDVKEADLQEEEQRKEINEQQLEISSGQKDAEVKIIDVIVPDHAIVAATNDVVNFRSEPSYGENVIRVLSPNTAVSILNNLKLEGDFYSVIVDGYEGYLYKDLVTIPKFEFYATSDEKVNVGSIEKLVKKGSKISVYKAYNGDLLEENSFETVTNYENLVSQDDYKASRLKNAKFELVTSFTTYYSLEEEFAGKAFNINHCLNNSKLPERSINGMVIASSETFDWFRDVGDTNYNEGYSIANMFSGGQVVKGYGGGVCQVASTIYNCVLNLNLKVIERHAHGLPVEYVDYEGGKDAAVSDTYGGFNFVWKNTTDYDIYIKGYTEIDDTRNIEEGGVLTIEFYKIIY